MQPANNAEALASYAKMADDDTLRKMADRIQARAIRRCGELLKQYDGRGKNKGALTSSEAASDAGLTLHQHRQAIRVANVPADDFEQQVEGDNPPTITKRVVQMIAVALTLLAFDVTAAAAGVDLAPNLEKGWNGIRWGATVLEAVSVLGELTSDPKDRALWKSPLTISVLSHRLSPVLRFGTKGLYSACWFEPIDDVDSSYKPEDFDILKRALSIKYGTVLDSHDRQNKWARENHRSMKAEWLFKSVRVELFYGFVGPESYSTIGTEWLSVCYRHINVEGL